MDELYLKLKAEILRAATSSRGCRSMLMDTVSAMRKYFSAVKNSADIDRETGEVVRDGMPEYYEGFTREDFIDPILLALGWDVSKKRHVRIERRVDYDRVADYILRHSGGEAFAAVEAKKLNEALEKHEPQLFGYMKAAFTPMGILTNGLTWRIYEQREDEIRLVFEIEDITSELTEENARTICELIGFGKNHKSKRSRNPKMKPPSPLEDGWVET
jgi:hypothetical protein